MKACLMLWKKHYGKLGMGNRDVTYLLFVDHTDVFAFKLQELRGLIESLDCIRYEIEKSAETIKLAITKQ